MSDAPAAEAAPAATETPAPTEAEIVQSQAETLFPEQAKAPSTMVDDLTPEQQAEADKAKEAEKPAETAEEKAAREAAETPEQKAEREAKEAEDAKKAKADGAPEAYTDFTVPEGITLDEAILGDFKSLAKELNLTQEAAQKLIDLQATNATKSAEAAQAAVQAQQDEWQETIRTDKEFGGDKLNASLALAQKAAKQFGDPELTSLLAGPLGDHPAIVRTFARIGKAISEAPVIHGAKPATGDAANVLYPNLK